MWRYSLPGLLGMPALGAIAWIDPIVLSRSATTAEVGQYQLAYPIVTVCAVLGGSINAVFSPELVRAKTIGDVSAIERYKCRDRPRVALLMALMAFGGACLIGPVVRAAVPDSYAETAEIIGFLSVAGGFVLCTASMHPLVTATDSVWSLQTAVVVQAATNVAFDLLLAPHYGAQGIAIANILGWGLGFLTISLMLRVNIAAPIATTPYVLALGLAVTLFLLEVPAPGIRAAVGGSLVAVAGVGIVLFFRGRRRAGRTT
jgi:O-antigen/teichoic acid export membrane protein